MAGVALLRHRSAPRHRRRDLHFNRAAPSDQPERHPSL